MAVTIVCPPCLEHGRGRVEMIFHQEFAAGNTFECPRCGTIRFVTKTVTGGTVGSGAKGDGRHGAMSTGYGPGSSTFRKYHPEK